MRLSNTYRYPKNNIVDLSCIAFKCRIFIKGEGNKIVADRSAVAKAIKVVMEGNNNTLIIEKGAYVLGEYNFLGDNNTIFIGKNSCTGGGYFFAHHGTSLTIGEDCLLSVDSNIRTTDSHSILDENGKRINFEKDIVIGDRVWLGKGVTIMKGITVGNDVVVGTMSVVTKDIPNNTVSAGNPARVIKENTTWDEAIVGD